MSQDITYCYTTDKILAKNHHVFAYNSDVDSSYKMSLSKILGNWAITKEFINRILLTIKPKLDTSSEVIDLTKPGTEEPLLNCSMLSPLEILNMPNKKMLELAQPQKTTADICEFLQNKNKLDKLVVFPQFCILATCFIVIFVQHVWGKSVYFVLK